MLHYAVPRGQSWKQITLPGLLLGLALCSAASASSSNEGFDIPRAASPTCHEISSSIGSHMVLQRAPENAVLYGTVCGKLVGAKSISVSIDGATPTTAPISAGSTAWQIKLPPQTGGLAPHTLKITGGSLDVTLSDVLFGDMILCSGQSNMCFSTNQMTGASAEIALANDPKYKSIRLFTATPTYDKSAPHPDITVLQNWTAADSLSVGGGHNNKSFSYFSAACWLQGRHLFDKLGGKVPLGLLTSAVGGTRIKAWSSPDALKVCGGAADSDLWNTMIYPLLPMRFKFMVWLQSESDVCASDSTCKPQRGAVYYKCAIQAMIKDFRAKFNLALPFLWVQISPWEGHEAATTFNQLPDMRLAQMSANELPLTAVATAVDLGPPANAKGWDSGDEHGPDPWGNVHFRNKGPLGPRLSAAAMNIVYGNKSVVYQGPEAVSFSTTAIEQPAGRRCARKSHGVLNGNGTLATTVGSRGVAPVVGVRVSFKQGTVGGGLQWTQRECPYIVLKEQANFTTELDCKKSIDDCIKKCGWWDIEMGKGNWVLNATATISGETIVVSPPTDSAGCPLEGNVVPTGVRYLYADWPVATLYNTDGFPALPFVLDSPAGSS